MSGWHDFRLLCPKCYAEFGSPVSVDFTLIVGDTIDSAGYLAVGQNDLSNIEFVGLYFSVSTG